MAATCSWAPSIGVAGIACSARLYAWILGDLTQDHCFHVKTPYQLPVDAKKAGFAGLFPNRKRARLFARNGSLSVHQLDNRQRRIVARPEAIFDDPQITART